MRHSLALFLGSALAIVAAFWLVSAAAATKKTKHIGTPKYEDITIRKPVDKSSPTIMQRSPTTNKSTIKGESLQPRQSR